MKNFIVVLALLVLLPTITLCVPSTPPFTVGQVDINRYLGSWYEIALIPFFFEFGCTKTVATYSLNPDGSIRVAYETKIIKKQMPARTLCRLNHRPGDGRQCIER